MVADRIPPWEHLKTEPLLDHPWCTIVEDHVLLPSGQPITWWRFQHTADFVAIVCRNTQNQFLIAYQYNHPSRQVIDEFPGGGIEPTDASSMDAARRELLEETGIYAHTITVLGSFLPNNRRSASRCIVCLATDIELRSATPEATEIIAFEWVERTALEQRIRHGDIHNGMLLAAWSLYCAYERSDTDEHPMSSTG